MLYKIISILFFFTMGSSCLSQPIQPGHIEIVVTNEGREIEFYKIIKQKDCKSYSRCKYTIISKNNEFRMMIVSCSFSKATDALKIENGNIIVNTGIKLGEPYCIRSLILKNPKTNSLMSFDINGGNNLNKYLIELSSSTGAYKLEMDDRNESYKTIGSGVVEDSIQNKGLSRPILKSSDLIKIKKD